MSASDEDSLDLVRQALQVHVNEAGDGTWVVTHYVALVGLYRVDADGTEKTRPILVAPGAQPDYVTNGLFGEGPDLLALLAGLAGEDADAEDAE